VAFAVVIFFVLERIRAEMRLNGQLFISKHKRLKAIIHRRGDHHLRSLHTQNWRSVGIMGASFMVRKVLVSHESLIAARNIASEDFFFIFTMFGEMILEASLGG